MLGPHLFSFFQSLCAFSGALEAERGYDPRQDFSLLLLIFWRVEGIICIIRHMLITPNQFREDTFLIYYFIER